MKREDRSALIAAAIICFFAFGGWFVLPPIMQWLGTFSPWLALAVAIAYVGAFFVLFWLRARYQRRRRRP
ncbi:hypothetical protein [Pararhizobium mangrovi]|uniref:Uncharacterized protein n=1 Tax=Pararhizobium mangrovi TaxID=2590452 RepID=A0A506UBD9_9HYPH|nr:hypothetical protein [Pararhizobium mangrovi]TPW30686.1 hypothetical protein FJU11_04485 [Pararhizobium mangrovi]